MVHTYLEYFSWEDREKEYRSREEYTRDLLILADTCLEAACEEKKKGRRILRGTVAFDGKLSESLTGGEPGSTERFSEEARGECAMMSAHIGERTAQTKENGAFLWYEFLCRKFRLQPWEEFALLLAVVNHMDRKYERIFAYLQDDAKALFPTLGLAKSMFDSIFPSEYLLVRYQESRLFQTLFKEPADEEISGSGLAAPLLVRRPALEYLGLLPEKEKPVYEDAWMPWERPVIREKEIGQLQAVFSQWEERKETAGFLHLYGEEGSGRHLSLCYGAKAAGAGLLFFDCREPETAKERLERLSDAALKAELENRYLCLDMLNLPPGSGGEEAEGPVSWLIRKTAARLPHFVVLSKDMGRQYLPSGINRVEQAFSLLSTPEKEAVWRAEAKRYRISPEVDLKSFAQDYILSVEKIRGALAAASIKAVQDGRREIAEEDLRQSIAQYTTGQLGRFAVRKNAAFTWEDLILEESQKRVLHHICNQFRFRDKVRREWDFEKKSPYGNGISAVFYGAPGTGKTMAVQVIANELGIDLYRVDASQLVSKYIGETEKNISELFTRAKNVNALLFFDEADALFARRSEVRDAHDRNANAETAHLLQMFEDYSGITILATNYISNMDEAFKRRIKFSLEFQLPDEKLRLLLWESILTEKVKENSFLDLRFFAKNFELSGSNIKEVITNAAYMAAAEGVWPENRHVVEALRLYYQKAGKRLSDAELGYLAGE